MWAEGNLQHAMHALLPETGHEVEPGMRLAGEWVKALVGGLQAVLRFAKLHDDLLSAKDPVLTLRLAAAFCMLAVLSNVFRCSRIVPCAPCPAA